MHNLIKIISLNVSYGLMLDELVSYIKSNTPSTSIFCLQEVDAKTKKTLDDTLINRGYQSYYESKYDGNEKFLLATYIKKSTKLIKKSCILKNDSSTGLAVNYFVSHHSGKTLNITNFHGFPRPGTKLDTPERITQSKAISDYIFDKADLSIIAGDFNLMPRTKSLEILMNCGYENLILKYGIKNTRTHIAWDKHPDSKQHYADYFFVKSDTGRLEPRNLIADEIVLSDHLPLVLEVTSPDERYLKPKTKLVSNSGKISVSQVLNAEKQV